jgi:hypothetical protein
MKIWLECDSETFEVWTEAHPYGDELELPDELVAEYKAARARLGLVQRKILEIYDSTWAQREHAEHHYGE